MNQNPDIDMALSEIGLDEEGIRIELELLLGGTSTSKEIMKQRPDDFLKFLNLGFLSGVNGISVPNDILKKPDSTLPPDLEKLAIGFYKIGHRAGAFVEERKYDESTGVMIYTRVATDVLRPFIGRDLTADLQRTMIDAYFGKPQH